MKRREFIRSGLLSLASGTLGVSAFGRTGTKALSAKADFYVAPNGEDSNPGTAMRTVCDARAGAR